MPKLITQSVNAPKLQNLQLVTNAKLHQVNGKLDTLIARLNFLVGILIALFVSLLIGSYLAWCFRSQASPPVVPSINKFALVLTPPPLQSAAFVGPAFDEAESTQCLYPSEEVKKRFCALEDWSVDGLNETRLDNFLKANRRIVLVTIESGHDRKPLTSALRKTFSDNLGLARSRGEHLRTLLLDHPNKFPIVITVRPALESKAESFPEDRKVKITVIWEPTA